MKSEFALAFNEILEDKGLPRETIMSAIEAAMVSAYRKSVGASAAQDVKVEIDLDQGVVKVFAEKEVVEDFITDSRTEVLLDQAREIDPNCQAGDLVMVESTPENFGRIAAQTARQGIQQKIRDAEKATQFEFFSKQVGEIISGVVQAVNSRQATIGLDLKAEGTMLRKDMIPGERFRLHDRIRAYVYEVKDSPKGLQILLSRGHRNFLRRLLENEVPEIYHGIVEIRSIAREPGQRAKVAVSATQIGIDPVGACVGQRGVRIQAIVRELHDEKIDVIEWSSDAAVYISKAISPARVSGVYLNMGDGDNKTAIVVVPEDQLSLAIGREGQNARLAAKLTGWRIDIMSVTEAAGKALVKLREEASLAEMAEQEADTIPKVEELLVKKEEGRALSLDDITLLSRFVDRVERRGEADRKAQDDALQLKLKELRSEIHPSAFEIPIADIPDLSNHVSQILQDGGLLSFGDLILQTKLDADVILSYNGIGPKTFEEILELVRTYPFPAVEEPAEVAEPAEEEEVPETEVVVEAEESLPEMVDEVAPEAVEPEATEAEEDTEETPAEEQSFEELFKMESIRRQKEDLEPSYEEEMGYAPPKKQSRKASKKKRGYTVEYDPDLDEDIVRYKHKGDDDWEDW
ncbi:MAG: transcription termination factor NusA [Anaerolineaceae bacterium]|jgi:N utilization substance protein A